MNRESLHEYQNNAIAHITSNSHCGLFLDMGLGKTVSTLTAISDLLSDLDVLRVLVVAPKRVAESVWTSEIEKWEHLKDLKIVKIAGDVKKRRAALIEKAEIYTIGRDNLSWLCGLYGGSMLPFDMLVIDESSSFKSPQSQRFKSLKAVQPCFRRVVILTGTPAPNGLIDLWSQIYLLDRGQRLGKTITEYRKNHFSEGLRNGHVVYNYKLIKNEDKKIHEKISDICLSMKAKDYLSLPQRIDNYINIDFDKSLQKKYNDFEEELILQIINEMEEDTEIAVTNAAALSNKLLQFANGAVYDSEKKYHRVHDLKLDALEEIVENSLGKPVLVAYTYQHDLERILERLKKYKPRKLDTESDIKEWNRGEIPVLVMHPASGGHGLNLQSGGNTIVWFGQTWSLELYMQFNARLDRQGQKEAVIVHHLIANKTIDNEVIKALKNKNRTQEGLMEAIKAKIKKYEKTYLHGR